MSVRQLLSTVTGKLLRYQQYQDRLTSPKGALYSQRDSSAPLAFDPQFLISLTGTVVEDDEEWAALQAAKPTGWDGYVAVYRRNAPGIFVRNNQGGFDEVSPIFFRDHFDLNSFFYNPLTGRMYWGESTGFYALTPEASV